MRERLTRVGLTLLGAAGLSIATTELTAQRSNRIAVSSTYPMGVMAGVLETRYGWIVTYEDAPLVNERDVVEQEIDLPQGLPPVASAGWREVFDLIFPAHEGRDNAGRFTVVERAPGFFHIVPRQFRDANGVWQPTQSPFDAAISFPQRSARQPTR